MLWQVEMTSQWVKLQHLCEFTFLKFTSRGNAIAMAWHAIIHAAMKKDIDKLHHLLF
jgi:hypothetical protein